MQRGTYAIAISAQSVEGGLVVRGETQPALSQTVLAQAPPAAVPAGAPAGAPAGQPGPAQPAVEALLVTFLQQAQWEYGMTVLVVPTEQISVRRLHFGFSDLKKIRNVLPLELENELLDSVAKYAYDFELRPRGDGTADVLVYLLEQSAMRPLVAVLDQHQLSPQRVTFAARALVEAVPPPEGCHFTIYVGAEEAFIVQTQDKRILALQSLHPHPGSLLPDLAAIGPGSPTDQLQSLFRADADDAPRKELRERLQERLEATREAINRFMRIYSSGQPCTVSLHGLFGELYERQPNSASLSLRFPVGAWPGARRTHVGVMDELLAQPRNFPTVRGPNFHRRVGTWIAAMRELRWPLTAAAALLVVLLGLLGTSFFLRTAALQARLDAAGLELQRTLKISPPITSITVNSALGRIQERVDKARKEREAVAYIDRYHYDTLRLFNEMSDAVHKQSGITVDALSFNQDRFAMSGTTPSYEESESLKNRFGELERFKGRTVKVTHSNVGKVIRYRLTVER